MGTAALLDNPESANRFRSSRYNCVGIFTNIRRAARAAKTTPKPQATYFIPAASQGSNGTCTKGDMRPSYKRAAPARSVAKEEQDPRR